MDIATAVVVIGRNEGERLRRCLESIPVNSGNVVYVDSGSSDGSAELARSMGAQVVDLDMSMPFTAARARNSGFERLQQITPAPAFVQFVDGDCEIQPDWLEAGARALANDDHLGAVAGQLRERFAKASIYNRLCDMEWRSVAGPTTRFPGIVMIRSRAFIEAGGYNAQLIAGEDPELALRITRDGWAIARLDAEMALHDAHILHWRQWWRRMVRAGHAWAEGAALHGAGPEQYAMKPTIRAVIFGLIFPAVFVVCCAMGFWRPRIALLALAPVMGWIWMIGRSYQWRRQMGDSVAHSAEYAMVSLPSRLAEATGVVLYSINRMRGRRHKLIEYKHDSNEARLLRQAGESPGGNFNAGADVPGR